jgi:hypothetical protein
MKCPFCLTQADYRCTTCLHCAGCCRCSKETVIVHLSSRAYAEAIRQKTLSEERARLAKPS